MRERDGYMPGVPCWVDTSQPDPEAAVAFYGGLFGWEFEDAMPPDSAHRGARIVNEPGSLNFNGLNTRDADGAKSFYGSVFGWETLDIGGGAEMWRLRGYGGFLEQSEPGLRRRMADSGAPRGFEDVVATLNPIADDQPDVPAHWSVTFAVDDADATAERANELGGQVVVAPFDAPWVRMTVITDPQGATFIASKFVPANRDLSSQAAPAARAA
jgi:uncharacterized protein